MEQRQNRRRRGFSLVELMVVMVILAMLATVIAVSYTKHVEEAKRQATLVNVKLLKDQVLIYKMRKGEYPADLKDLIPDYIEDETTMKDGWGHEFYYTAQGDNAEFEIVSAGGDGDFNTTEDNINSWALGKEDEQP